ncbi:natural resistance-associated macrophage protein [Metschnikowia bicuspidata var. bicuspidata NRRL YB-4993]|uniref:Natural resistance-associated macrophage protein n=1 Tax=Metschnikowia bicuspidata var. bicuspidata NRRL YB-4993 TaxID=869754 RepID=A0A1A0HJH0_9ASCO|nr:natural resistance-associated macrophage protein [Metschnikowia bicuspidata var. bicuspidata NRRL YB-4993]OBA24160.1 natural resistance-associated macrophage protein [Metschnikowia bicuspidata var. bicuspidata NRRL YB-4993]
MGRWVASPNKRQQTWQQASRALRKYASFIGPGIMVSVAYMDPGNYLTAVALGADYKYSLLVVVFMSNVFAVILQCLCVKLGSVTGLDLAEMCRLTFPWWLNLGMYVCAEFAIVATDLAEVVGTAIALEILFGIPLVAGTFITVLDVLCVLLAYHKDGSMRQIRLFEIAVTCLVAATCVCFAWELFSVDFAPGSARQIVRGFLPVDGVLFRESNALFLSCGIVGSTVMPHSLFLGSSIVQSRLKDYDQLEDGQQLEDHRQQAELSGPLPVSHSKLRQFSDGRLLARKYKPSYAAIKHCLNFSYTELVLSLFLIAVFVNSAILIVAGATLYGKPDADNADLLSIYELLSHYISPAAGLVFALSMLFSGQSAGIVCTMAGQIVSEGFINWSFKPWVRRLVTRVLAIVPVVIFISVMGREGVSTIMNLSQVVLSFILPVVSAPLIYFTATRKYMTVYEPNDPVATQNGSTDETSALIARQVSRRYYTSEPELLDNLRRHTFENGFWLNAVAIATWVTITFLNLYLIYLFSIGVDV